MGIYKNGTYWWLWLPRPGQKAIRESTKIPIKAPTPELAKINKQSALDAFAARMGELARTRYALPEPKTDIPTFDAYVTSWYEPHVLPRHKGQEREREILKTLRKAFGTKSLKDITPDLVRAWHTERLKKVVASTINRETNVLKTVLAAAVPSVFPVSPLHKMKRLRETPREPVLLTRPNERKLLKELTPTYRALVLVGLDCLVRQGSILNLKWSEVSADHLLIADPKGGKSYRVPTSPRVNAALKKLPKTDAFVFPELRIGATRYARYNKIRLVLRRACERAGVPWSKKEGGITFHGATRHTGASRAINEGKASPYTVQAIGGWKDARMLARYVHPTEEGKVAAVRAIAGQKLRRRS